ncbi:hypothetical protein STRTUCAR8_01518 [Streptomyces turgidiscabies Car8]|uniref:Uncharacterized protein n=1 Tax=Streptomyces turgidiscabies (strain Car8) TaxID=698760 RepID=L7F6A2_STRT8|nr:hypothetical protein STRTUCAR8_01518 [Streptomyces turgidiscabies Car8]
MRLSDDLVERRRLLQECGHARTLQVRHEGEAKSGAERARALALASGRSLLIARSAA